MDVWTNVSKIVMSEEDQSLLAFWGAPNGGRGRREDRVTQTPFGGNFSGMIVRTTGAIPDIAKLPAKDGFRQATLSEVMRFLKECLERRTPTGLATDEPLIAGGTWLWFEGSFYLVPGCIPATGRYPNAIEVYDGRMGLPTDTAYLIVKV